MKVHAILIPQGNFLSFPPCLVGVTLILCGTHCLCRQKVCRHCKLRANGTEKLRHPSILDSFFFRIKLGGIIETTAPKTEVANNAKITGAEVILICLLQ